MDKSRIESILAPVPAGRQSRRERFVRNGFWAKLRRVARRVPFVEDLVAAYFCAMDTQTPFAVRGTLLAALAYFILPFDIIPDVILGVGFTDDFAVLMYAIKSISDHMKPQHYAAARRTLEEESFADGDAA